MNSGSKLWCSTRWRADSRYIAKSPTGRVGTRSTQSRRTPIARAVSRSPTGRLYAGPGRGTKPGVDDANPVDSNAAAGLERRAVDDDPAAEAGATGPRPVGQPRGPAAGTIVADDEGGAGRQQAVAHRRGGRAGDGERDRVGPRDAGRVGDADLRERKRLDHHAGGGRPDRAQVAGQRAVLAVEAGQRAHRFCAGPDSLAPDGGDRPYDQRERDRGPGERQPMEARALERD